MANDLTPEEEEALSRAIGDTGSGGASEGELPLGVAFGEPAAGSNAEKSNIAGAQFLQLEQLASLADVSPRELERMSDVKVHVEVIIGSAKMKLEQILKLREGSVVELDKLAGEPVDITVNGHTIAHGEIVVVDDYFGVKIMEIVGYRQKLTAAQTMTY